MLPVSRSVALVVAGVLSVAHLTIAFAVGFGKGEPLFYQQVILLCYISARNAIFMYRMVRVCVRNLVLL